MSNKSIHISEKTYQRMNRVIGERMVRGEKKVSYEKLIEELLDNYENVQRSQFIFSFYSFFLTSS